MILFDKFEDALEEAHFCANTERAKYLLVLRRDGRYRVTEKGGGRLRQSPHIEIGFIHKRFRSKEAKA